MKPLQHWIVPLHPPLIRVCNEHGRIINGYTALLAVYLRYKKTPAVSVAGILTGNLLFRELQLFVAGTVIVFQRYKTG